MNRSRKYDIDHSDVDLPALVKAFGDHDSRYCTTGPLWNVNNHPCLGLICEVGDTTGVLFYIVLGFLGNRPIKEVGFAAPKKTVALLPDSANETRKDILTTYGI